ncbi:MAG: hypothetical protein ABJC12_08500 [Saprospiraceae bacterium]
MTVLQRWVIRLFLLFCLPFSLAGQTYYVTGYFDLWQLTISGGSCTYNTIGSYNLPGNPAMTDIAICSNGTLYGSTSNEIWEINLATAAATLVLSGSNLNITGLVCAGNDILYASCFQGAIYEINVTLGIFTLLGSTGLYNASDLVFSNGSLYMTGTQTMNQNPDLLVEVNLMDPANSSVVMSSNETGFFNGLCLGDFCNALLTGGTSVVSIPLILAGSTLAIVAITFDPDHP